MRKYRFDNNAPETVVALPGGKVRVFYSRTMTEEKRAVMAEENSGQEPVTETVTVWECRAVDLAGELTKQRYHELVGAIMADSYTQADELAILRQRDTKPEEFSEYNKYAENVKAFARDLLGLGQEE